MQNNEKIFSLFERHTEWISKGKAGVPVELGLRVCVLQDQFGFTLHHLVMEKQTDDQITVTIAEGAKQRFPQVSQVRCFERIKSYLILVKNLLSD